MSAEEAERVPFTPGSQCLTINPVKARLEVFGQQQVAAVEPGAETVTFTLELQQTGVTQLEAWFVDAAGEERGAYYVYVERL